MNDTAATEEPEPELGLALGRDTSTDQTVTSSSTPPSWARTIMDTQLSLQQTILSFQDQLLQQQLSHQQEILDLNKAHKKAFQENHQLLQAQRQTISQLLQARDNQNEFLSKLSDRITHLDKSIHLVQQRLFHQQEIQENYQLPQALHQTISQLLQATDNQNEFLSKLSDRITHLDKSIFLVQQRLDEQKETSSSSPSSSPSPSAISVCYIKK